MSALLQIESAVAQLPPAEQKSLLLWLESRLAAGSPASPVTLSALEAFRQLQREARLTPKAAAEWKTAVMNARR